MSFEGTSEALRQSRGATWLMCFAIALLVDAAAARATVDEGRMVTFVGFTGADGGHALLVELDVHADAGEGDVYAVAMSGPVRRSDQVTLGRLSDAAASDEPQPSRALRRALEDGHAGAIWRTWLATLPAQRRSIHASGFQPASEASALPRVESEAAESAGRLTLSLGAGATLDVSTEVLSTFAAVQVHDGEHDAPCLDRDAKGRAVATCTGCTAKRVGSHGVFGDTLVCGPRPGTLRPAPPNIRKWLVPPSKVGLPCDCRDKGYVVAPRLRVASRVTRGLPVLVYGEVMNSRPYFVEETKTKPPTPNHGDVKAWRNAAGQILVVGSLADEPQMNGTFFPLVATHPGHAKADRTNP